MKFGSSKPIVESHLVTSLKPHRLSNATKSLKVIFCIDKMNTIE